MFSLEHSSIEDYFRSQLGSIYAGSDDEKYIDTVAVECFVPDILKRQINEGYKDPLILLVQKAVKLLVEGVNNIAEQVGEGVSANPLVFTYHDGEFIIDSEVRIGTKVIISTRVCV